MTKAGWICKRGWYEGLEVRAGEGRGIGVEVTDSGFRNEMRFADRSAAEHFLSVVKAAYPELREFRAVEVDYESWDEEQE